MPQVIKNTWLNYIQKTTSQQMEQPLTDLVKVSEYLSLPQQFHNFFRHSIPMMYIVDYTTGQYRVASDSVQGVLGYRVTDFTEGGVGFTIEKYHPDDLRLFNEQIFPDRLNILKSMPPEQHKDYIFSFTYRLKDGHGTFTNLLQRNCFVHSDAKGNPLLSMGMVINLEHHCSSNPVTQSIERMATGVNPFPDLIEKKHYYLYEEDRFFSEREKEILKLSIEGLTHKEIAARLFVAEGTVLQHRKNMLRKSNTKNVAELVGYAFKNQLL